MLQRGFGRDEFERKWSRPRRGRGPPPCREPRCADSRRWSTVASAFLFLLLIGSEPQLLVRPKSIHKWLRRWADIAWVPSSLPRVHWLHSWAVQIHSRNCVIPARRIYQQAVPSRFRPYSLEQYQHKGLILGKKLCWPQILITLTAVEVWLGSCGIDF